MKNIVDFLFESTTELLKKSNGFNFRELLSKKSFKGQQPIALSNECCRLGDIKSLAKNSKLKALVIYLDRTEPEDLDGISKLKGKILPEWAAEIKDNPNDRFVVIFDEMETVVPKVLNALMPIVIDGIDDNALIILHGYKNIEEFKENMPKAIQSKAIFVA